MIYECPRCGYKTKQRGDIKKHFLRKKLCSPISSTLNLRECVKEVLGNENEFFLKLNPYESKLNPKKSQSESKMNPNESKMDSKNSYKKSESPCLNDQSSITLYENISESGETYINPEKEHSLDSQKSHDCKYCLATFSTNSNMHKHMKVCKKRHLYTKEELDEKLATKDILINELKKQIEVLLTKVGNTTNIQQNIFINPFGKENTEYIDEGHIKNLLEGVKGEDFIPHLIKDIHFNPQHQENWNVCIPNKKQALAKVFNGAKWIYQKKKNTIENMTNKAYKTIIDNYDENNNKSWKNIVDNSLYHDDSEIRDKIDSNTELMILNSQNIMNNPD